VLKIFAAADAATTKNNKLLETRPEEKYALNARLIFERRMRRLE
jgi:hypothetical protein